MKANFLKKKINYIKLSKSNSSLSFFASKGSFLDKKISNIKDIFMEINKVGKNEYERNHNEFYSAFSQYGYTNISY